MCAAARSCPAPATAGHKAHCCFRRGRRLPTVVPTDSRPLSWPPIGALPRNRLASSATGGASPISPTTRPHRASSPRLRRAGCPHLAAATHRTLKTPCHCEPVRTLVWQSVLPRTAPHKGNGLPRRCAPRNDIFLVGAKHVGRAGQSRRPYASPINTRRAGCPHPAADPPAPRKHFYDFPTNFPHFFPVCLLYLGKRRRFA